MNSLFIQQLEHTRGPEIDERLQPLDFAPGIAFEMPIAIVILVWSGVTTVATLSKARPYVFLGAFVVGMLLTPPDMFSQTLLALPMYMLFESGLIMARLLLRKAAAESPAEADQPDEDDD